MQSSSILLSYLLFGRMWPYFNMTCFLESSYNKHTQIDHEGGTS